MSGFFGGCEGRAVSCVFESLGGCAGRLDPHHVVKQQHIRKEFPYGALCLWRTSGGVELVPIPRGSDAPADVSLDALLADGRNIVPACRFHHDQHHNARIYLDPPESAVQFAAELGLLHVIEKQKARAA